MKLNKQILEAIHKGINIALDDFDFNDINQNDSNSIIDDNKYIEKRIRFNHLVDYYRVLSKEELKELADLHYQYGFVYTVPTKSELIYMIKEYICWIDEKADLNWMDVSKITDFACLFEKSKFIGNISEWDVSNVTTMQWMFRDSNFNGDLSNWDVSNVTNMVGMFVRNERFDKDISRWNVSNVTLMDFMFYGAKSFRQDISNWKLHPSLGKQQLSYMFIGCPISKKHKPLRLQ